MEKTLKMYRLSSSVLMISALFMMFAAIYNFAFAITDGSSHINDVTFVALLLTCTFLFFTGALFDQLGQGRQSHPVQENMRKSSIRSAIYGIVASMAGVLILVVAVLTLN